MVKAVALSLYIGRQSSETVSGLGFLITAADKVRRKIALYALESLVKLDLEGLWTTKHFD